MATQDNMKPAGVSPATARGQGGRDFRLTAALLGIAAVVGIILLILSFRDEGPPTSGGLLDAEMPGVKTAQIDALELERPDGGTLLITRVGENDWQIQKPITVRADAARVLPVIDALLKAKPTPYKELTSDLALHGLNPPSLKVTIRQGNERSATVNLGNVTFGEDKGVVFVTTTSQPKPMAVRRSDLDVLFNKSGDGTAGSMARWTSDYRSPAVFPSDLRMAGDDVASVTLTLPNKGKTLALTRVLGGNWQFVTPAGWGNADSEGDMSAPPGSITGVRKMLGSLTSLAAGTPDDFLESPKDLKEYGLNRDNPDLVKAEVKTRDGQSATVYIGKFEAGPPAPPSMPGMPPMPGGGKVYVQIEGQPGVIRATGDVSGLVAIINDPNPLRDRTLISAEPNRVDGIDLLLPGQTLTKLRRAGALRQWTLYGGPGDPQKAFIGPVEKILEALLARRNIKDFPAPDPKQNNFSTISATVFIYVDGFAPPPEPKFDPKADPKSPPKGDPEPVKKGEPIKIEFGHRAPGDAVYVRRTLPGQPPSEFTLLVEVKTGLGNTTTNLLAAVTKTRLELLDPKLPEFSSLVVNKLTVSGQNNYVLDKDEKPDPYTKEAVWRYAPPNPKTPTADARNVSQMLTTLATQQQVERFVDEEPTEARLIDYGFKPNPKLKVVVGLKTDSPDKTREIEFGNLSANPDYVYARVPGKQAVFTVPKHVFDAFANPDLKDRAIFRFDPAEATKVRLTGWGSAGFETELVFEKKDGTWVVAKGPKGELLAPAGYAVDPAKVNAFLEMLTRQRVKTFLPGPLKPEHGFGDKKVYLVVNVDFKSMPGLGFNIGAETDGGASYFGWTTWTPDTPFTLDSTPLKPYKTTPGAFAR
ncbi:MAG: DUF4340 domain-containing protein [Planctomycetia bacterium]|nr:DUF4340 domain-containing protein [Planctomycetia bacterium]